MPEFDQEQFNQLIMQYLAGQMGKQQQQALEPESLQQDQQNQQQPGIQALIDMLMGKSQQGLHPHLSSLENILSRLQGPDQQGNMNPFGNTSSSSFMNAQNQANKPLSWGQKAGQFFGGALQDFAPLAGAAGGAAFGPLGALAGPAASLAGQGINYASQPYQLPR